MKAIVYTRYGSPDVLELKEIPKPTPKASEVLIKVHATTVTSGDWRARTLSMPKGFGLMGRLFFGIFKPRQPVLGTELAGRIESIGSSVRKFKVGDRVVGFSGASMGCHAEYKCMREDQPLALIPSNLSYEEAAALSFGGMSALDFFRRAKLQSGDRVLINGASGAVGSAAVQLAKHFGAHVTGVCGSGNVALVKSLGADDVIDYTNQDFTQNGVAYDVIVDTAGTAPFSRSKHSLKPRGRLLLVLASMPDLLESPWLSLTTKHRVIAGPASERPEDLLLLTSLAEAGRYNPVIGRRYPFAQIAEAHRYVDTGHKRGNVVITLEASN
jgi:NADPH:quinone reductase-like Zn-dependent oxidoreductase